jgi:hypothetical protein
LPTDEEGEEEKEEDENYAIKKVLKKIFPQVEEVDQPNKNRTADSCSSAFEEGK